MQSHPTTPIMQLSIAVASLCVAASATVFAVKSMSDERNAHLVEIGVGILRVDPEKDAQVSAARQWALDLIDANAGGVRFSPVARAELLKKRLRYDYLGSSIDPGFPSGSQNSGSAAPIPQAPQPSR